MIIHLFFISNFSEEHANVELNHSKRMSLRAKHKWNVEGFNVVDVPMDGDCMFSSIAHQLHLNGVHSHVRSAMDVRQELVGCISYNADLSAAIKNGLPIGESFSDYIDDMGKHGVWGDGTMLAVAARCYSCDINVYSEGVREPMHIAFRTNSDAGLQSTQCTTTSRPTLNLAFVATGNEQDHYVSLIPQVQELNTSSPGQ